MRQMYMSFENDIGTSRADWFLRFNPEQLNWEINHAALAMVTELKRKERQVAIITAIDMDDAGTGSPSHGCASSVLNTLLGVNHAFPSRKEQVMHSGDEGAHSPSLYIWGRPFIFHSHTRNKPFNRKQASILGEDVEPQIKDVIFLRAYGLFDSEQVDFLHEDSISLRKALINFVLLMSSTVILCKHENNKNWVKQLDEFMDTVNEPPLFGTQEDRRSLLVCTKRENNIHPQNLQQQPQPLVQAYDLLTEIHSFAKQYPRDRYLEDMPFMSCMTNWFGKLHALYYTPPNSMDESSLTPVSPSITANDGLLNQLNTQTQHQNSHEMIHTLRSDIWTFVNDLAHTLNFGWPLGRWLRMRPYGDVCAKYMEHCVNEANKRPSRMVSVNRYDKIISKFGRGFLNAEMQAATEFYRRALHEELNKAVPLEMHELVNLSEMHADSALRTFTQSVSPGLFCHQVIDDMETNLKQAINTDFRPLWRENGQNSENYCQQIFDSCFKWAKAEYDCPSKPNEEFKRTFAQKFDQSLQMYIENARGTRKFQVMSFFCRQYIDLIVQIYPDMKFLCDRILLHVEHRTMQGTVELDKERSFLQKLSRLKLKRITLENSLQRLKEEITARQLQSEKSEQYQLVVENKLEKLGILCKQRKKWSSVRALFVDSCKMAIEQDLQKKLETETQISQLQQEFHSSFMATTAPAYTLQSHHHPIQPPQQLGSTAARYIGNFLKSNHRTIQAMSIVTRKKKKK